MWYTKEKKKELQPHGKFGYFVIVFLWLLF